MTNEEAIRIISETPVTYANPDEQGVWDEAIHLAIAALERDRWISTEERLPEENGFYLVKVGSSYNPVRVYRYEPDEMFDGNLWRGNDGSYMHKHFVTHWKPLPEPPKEDKP